MSELDEIEMEKQEAGGIVKQFICRAPKKNHEGMVQLAKEFTDIFRKHGEYFQLSNTEDMAVFTNIAKTASSSQDEEVCMEQIFFRDSKHKDEYIAKCTSDDNTERLYKQFINLITPDSAIMSEFNHICSVGD
jgi:uncharacterized protein YbaA (DUF1428 family)